MGLFTGLPPGTPGPIRDEFYNELNAYKDYAQCVLTCLGDVAVGEAETQVAEKAGKKAAICIAKKAGNEAAKRTLETIGQKIIPGIGQVSTAISAGQGIGCFSTCKNR